MTKLRRYRKDQHDGNVFYYLRHVVAGTPIGVHVMANRIEMEQMRDRVALRLLNARAQLRSLAAKVNAQEYL